MTKLSSRVADPKYDVKSRWWFLGILFTAAGLASIVVGILCLTNGKPHIPLSGGHLYGLGLFLIFLGICLLLLSLNDLLKVPWHSILPASVFDRCYDFERIIMPRLHRSDAGIMACILLMAFASVVLLILGIVLAAGVPPFSHVRDLWVGIVFIVCAFMLCLWLMLMCAVINGPSEEAAGNDSAPAGGYAIKRSGPYSEPAEAPAGPQQA